MPDQPLLDVFAPTSWSPSAADHARTTLQAVRSETLETLGALRRTAARAQLHWRGPARDAFDEQLLRLERDLRAFADDLAARSARLESQITYVTTNFNHLDQTRRPVFDILGFSTPEAR